MSCAVYTRVSTSGQDTAAQRDELHAVAAKAGWSVAVEYEDAGISGAKGRTDRPGLDALLKAVTRREVDRVLVWSVDRLGRSLKDLLATLSEIQAAGCELYIHKQALDTATPSGKALFGMLGVFAEFERELIRERVQAGVDRAKAKGVKLGRPGIKPYVRRQIVRLLAEGKSLRKIAAEAGVSLATVQRVKANGLQV